MKLSDFKGDEGVKVVGKILLPACYLIANKEVAKASKKGLAPFIAAALQNCPKEMHQIFAILNGKEPEEYEMNGATAMIDALALFDDEALLWLFGLQS